MNFFKIYMLTLVVLFSNISLAAIINGNFSSNDLSGCVNRSYALHLTLPEGDDDFSKRWKLIKTHFSKGFPQIEKRSMTRINRGERGIWQLGFWDHTIRNDRNYVTHMDYLHFNPVKLGWVDYVIDWPYSSFHQFVERGIYPVN